MLHNKVDDFNTLFEASKLLRKELSSHPKWAFKGSFDDFIHPKIFISFLRWVLPGPNLSVESEKRTRKIENAVSVAAQVLKQSFKTTRQSSYSGHSFHNTIETPLNVGIGLSIHHTTRSKGIVDQLYNLQLSISYEKVLRFITALANSVADKTVGNNGVYIPTGIDPSKQVYFAIDYTDISSKSRHGDFHGTATVVYQPDQQLNHSVELDRDQVLERGYKPRPIYDVKYCPVPTDFNEKFASYFGSLDFDSIIQSMGYYVVFYAFVVSHG